MNSAFRNKLTSVVRTARRDYHSLVFEMYRDNTKKTWNTINKLFGKNKGINDKSGIFVSMVLFP